MVCDGIHPWILLGKGDGERGTATPKHWRPEGDVGCVWRGACIERDFISCGRGWGGDLKNNKKHQRGGVASPTGGLPDPNQEGNDAFSAFPFAVFMSGEAVSQSVSRSVSGAGRATKTDGRCQGIALRYSANLIPWRCPFVLPPRHWLGAPREGRDEEVKAVQTNKGPPAPAGE